MTDEANLDSRKAQARQAARAKRAASIDPQAAAGLIKHYPDVLKSAAIVAGYWPTGTEIDCRTLLSELAEHGVVIALPRIESRDDLPVFRAWRAEDALAPDAFGILSPPKTALPVLPHIVLTPLLAFDRAGRRLGQGGGHYDRTLASLKAEGAIAVGLAYASQEMVEVPAGALDQKLDWILTEREAIRVFP
jgi:5-formyltetrahydrofolate cyclo-ligase